MVMSSPMFAGVSTGHAQEQCAWQLRHGDFAAALSSRGSFCSGDCGSPVYFTSTGVGSDTAAGVHSS